MMKKCRHNNISCNIIRKEVPRTLQQRSVLYLSLSYHFLDTLHKKAKSLSSNIKITANASSVFKGFTSCDPMIFPNVVIIFDEFPGVKKC